MSWESTRVLITGISGFVGPYLARELAKKGANIYGLMRRRADGTISKNMNYFNIADKVQLLEGELTDITSLAFALDESKPDVTFHLAAQSFVQRSFINPLETQQIFSRLLE